MATRAEICMKHKTCTNCPVRKECTVRPTFYSNEEYDEMISTSLVKAQIIGLLIGTPLSIIAAGTVQAKNMMDARRAQELKEHSEYSSS